MYDESATPTTIYASRVIGCTDRAWAGVRFPLEVEVPDAKLTISEVPRVEEGGLGFPDQSRTATLRFGRLRTPLTVAVEMTRWSGQAVEIGIRPPRHLPFWVSGDRYVRAVHAVLDRLAGMLTAPTADAVAELEGLPKSA
jgi:hypothetical protein